MANKYLRDNYVLVYKRKGEPKNIVKVEKPPITPVEHLMLCKMSAFGDGDRGDAGIRREATVARFSKRDWS